jgi:hypothetical protein
MSTDIMDDNYNAGFKAALDADSMTRVGRVNMAAILALNPHVPRSPGYASWNRGFAAGQQSVIAAAATEENYT